MINSGNNEYSSPISQMNLNLQRLDPVNSSEKKIEKIMNQCLNACTANSGFDLKQSELQKVARQLKELGFEHTKINAFCQQIVKTSSSLESFAIDEPSDNLQVKNKITLNLSQSQRVESINKYLFRTRGVKLGVDGFCNGDAALWALSIRNGTLDSYTRVSKFLSQNLKDSDFEKIEKNHHAYMALIYGKNSTQIDEIKKNYSELYLDHSTFLEIEQYLSAIMFLFQPESTMEGMQQSEFDKSLNILNGAYVDSPPVSLNEELVSPILTKEWASANATNKNQLIHKEFSFGFVLKKQELADIIPKIIPPNKIIMIGIPTHTCAAYFDGKNYYFFDPNSERGHIKCKDANALANAFQKMVSENKSTKESELSDNLELMLHVLDYENTSTFKYPEKKELIDEIMTSRGGVSSNAVNLNGSVTNSTSLRMACICGDEETQRILLSESFNKFHTKLTYQDSFQAAARLNNLDTIQKLIELGVKPDGIAAACNGSLISLKYLIENANISTEGLLSEAAASNRLKTFLYLLNLGCYDKGALENAFKSAAETGAVEIVEYLLKEKTFTKKTIEDALLMSITAFKSPNVFEMLIKEAKKMEISMNYPFLLAMGTSSKQAACYILENTDISSDEIQDVLQMEQDDAVNLISYMVNNEKLKLIEKILNSFNLNEIVNKPLPGSVFTPLINACIGNKYKEVKFWLENGADVNLQTKFNRSALYYAVMTSDVEIVKLLIEHQANQLTGSGEITILEQAKLNQNNDIIMLLQNNNIPKK